MTPKKKAECYIFATFCLNFFLQHRTSLLPEFSFQNCPVSLVYQAIFHQDLLLRPVFSLLPHTVCCSSSATVSVPDEVPLYDTDMLPDSLILAPSSIFLQSVQFPGGRTELPEFFLAFMVQTGNNQFFVYINTTTNVVNFIHINTSGSYLRHGTLSFVSLLYVLSQKNGWTDERYHFRCNTLT